MAVLNMKASDAGNAILIAAVKKDPENALPMLMDVGYTEEDAKAVIAGVQTTILEEEKEESLKDLKTELVDTFTTAGNDLWEGKFIPTDIEILHVDLSFYKEKTTLAGGQVVEPGFFVGMIKAHFTGVEKPVALGRVAKGGKKKQSAGGNGTKRSSVPTPEGIDSWAAYFKENYPDQAAALEGKSYSAPRELKKLEDKMYLAAEAANTTE